MRHGAMLAKQPHMRDAYQNLQLPHVTACAGVALDRHVCLRYVQGSTSGFGARRGWRLQVPPLRARLLEHSTCCCCCCCCCWRLHLAQQWPPSGPHDGSVYKPSLLLELACRGILQAAANGAPGLPARLPRGPVGVCCNSQMGCCVTKEALQAHTLYFTSPFTVKPFVGGRSATSACTCFGELWVLPPLSCRLRLPHNSKHPSLLAGRFRKAALNPPSSQLRVQPAFARVSRPGTYSKPFYTGRNRFGKHTGFL